MNFIPSTKEYKMKNTKLTLSTIFAGALLFGYTGARAHEGKEHAKGDAHAMGSEKSVGGMSSHASLADLDTQLQEISAQLMAGKLDGMHEHAEAIEAVTKDLGKDTTLDATKKKRVQGYVKNIAKLADKLHDAADEKKIEETKKAFSQLQAQVVLLDKQFGHAHKTATEAKHEESGHHDASAK
jgi:hypothetical protein